MNPEEIAIDTEGEDSEEAEERPANSLLERFNMVSQQQELGDLRVEKIEEPQSFAIASEDLQKPTDDGKKFEIVSNYNTENTN